MSRLAREYQRLFLPSGAPPAHGAERARALVLEVTGPAAWRPLGAVWQGVQAELDLPAPAIAVNGSSGLQLWFSLQEAVEVPVGLALLEHLRQCYMADVPQHLVAMHVTAVPAPVPMQMPGPADADSRWSAFVAPDLASVFGETPWLDLPPSEEGQAELLSRVASVQPAALTCAFERLQPPREAAAPVSTHPGPAPAASAWPLAAHPAAAQFLLRVMQDETAPLALRVEAGKALLPYAPPPNTNP